MIKLDSEVKSLDKVPKKYHSLYEEVKEDDKVTGYKLDKDLAKAISGEDLRAENKKLKEEIKENKSKIDELSKAKTKPKTDKDGQQSLLDKEPSNPGGDKNTNPKTDSSEISQLKKAFENQTKAMQKENESLKAEMKKIQETAENEKKSALQQKKESLVLEAIREKGGVPALIKNHVMESVGMDEAKNGRESLFIKDEDGAPKFVGSQKMGIDGFLDEMKKDKDFSRAFTEEKKGVGIDNFSGKGTAIKEGKELDLDNMSSKEEADYILKHGKESYLSATQKIANEQAKKVTEEYDKNSQKRSDLFSF